MTEEGEDDRAWGLGWCGLCMGGRWPGDLAAAGQEMERGAGPSGPRKWGRRSGPAHWRNGLSPVEKEEFKLEKGPKLKTGKFKFEFEFQKLRWFETLT